ncbi:hypothetical protein CRUP_005422 [Coryphaenoides rupestris]|nr:hypothetical protein CRUP_005422 [Coryphaenoides rupestris]
MDNRDGDSPDPLEPEVAVSSPMLPRKERPNLDGNLNEDDRLLPKDKDKTRTSGFLSLIKKKKKKNAPDPPKRSSSFREMDTHVERRGLTPDHARDADGFNNGNNDNDPVKFLSVNNNGSAGGITTNGAPAYPGPLFPRKKVPPAVPGQGGKAPTTPPGEEELVSNSKRFLRSSSASSMAPGSQGKEWKSVTLPRDPGHRHFDSGTFGGKPALPRKRANEQKGESVPRRGALTPPPRLPKKGEEAADEVFKEPESSLATCLHTLTPKPARRLGGLQGLEGNSKTSALQAELLKPNVFPALGAAADECRARRNKHGDSMRERAKFQKPKPAPPPPPPPSSNSKPGKASRSPTQEVLPSPLDGKPRSPQSESRHHHPTSADQSRTKLPLGSGISKPQPLKSSSSSTSTSVSASVSSPSLGGLISSVSSSPPPGDQPANAPAFIPLMTTRRSLRKTAPRLPAERAASAAVTRDMVLEGTELLRCAIGRNSEQTGSHGAVLEAGKNLSKHCVSYVESIQQMRNKFAFREAINKLEGSLRELQICPAASGGASGQQDFSKLLSSVKEISDIVQR